MIRTSIHPSIHTSIHIHLKPLSVLIRYAMLDHAMWLWIYQENLIYFCCLLVYHLCALGHVYFILLVVLPGLEEIDHANHVIHPRDKIGEPRTSVELRSNEMQTSYRQKSSLL